MRTHSRRPYDVFSDRQVLIDGRSRRVRFGLAERSPV